MIEKRLEEVCSSGRAISQRFRSKSVLGRGGMGWTIRAEDSLLPGQDVVLKFLYPHLIEKEGAVAGLRGEVLIARRLIHPHIVRTFNFSVDENLGHFIVMEFIEGVTLRKIIESEKEPLELSKVVELVYPLLLGIRHAHSLGVIHLDIKPENIFLSGDSQPKLGDFGLAKQILGIGGTSDRLQGTPLYMAPEQFRSGILSRQTDIYAIGIILFEMLSGRPPFVSSTLYNMSQLHLREPLPPLKEIRDSLPDWIVGLIERCCAKESQDRFESVDEIIQVFEHFGELPAPDDSYSPPYSASSSAFPISNRKISRLPFGKKALALVVLLLFLGFVHFGRRIGWLHTDLLYVVMKFEKASGIQAHVTRFLFRLTSRLDDPFFETRVEPGAIWAQLSNGASPNQIDQKSGRSFLQSVIDTGVNEKDFPYLLKFGANANHQDYQGISALHLLRGKEAVARAEALLHYGANINIRDKAGVTPLLLAVRTGEVELARFLFASGADPDTQDNSGLSAREEADASPDPRLRTLFAR